MSSTYSPILRTELIGSGDQAGTWGSTTNSNFQYILESAIAGYVAVTVTPTSNNQVLTYVNGPSANSALDQSVYATLKLNAGSLGANFNIFAPPVSKQYIVWNNTAYTATFYNSTVIGNTTAAGSGVVIPAGAKVWVWSDGTSFYGNDTIVGNLSIGGNLAVTGTGAFGGALSAPSLTLSGTPLAITSGGTGVTTSTGTGSTVLSISPALTGTPTAPTATAGTNTTQIATTAFVTQNAVLTGTINMWPTASAPSGYLLCDGSAVSRSTYAALFAVVSTTFGVGDGTTTFNLPNYTNRMPYGTTVGATGGSADAVVVSHTHTATSVVTDPGHAHSLNGVYGPPNSGQSGRADVNQSTQNYSTGSAFTGITVATTNASTGVSGTNANLPPYLGINFIIKT